MKRLFLTVALGMILMFHGQVRAEETYFQIVSSVGAWADLHQYSQARGKVTCRIPHGEIIKVTDDRGRFKYGVWVRRVSDQRRWEDPYRKKKTPYHPRRYICWERDRKGWVDTWDRHLTLTPRPDIRPGEYSETNRHRY